MANTFEPCPSCARHIKIDEAACPFCGAATPERFSEIVRAKGSAPLSRAALLFVGATAVTGATAAACGSSSKGPGPEATDSGAGFETSPAPAYGPAIIDSGVADSGQPAVLYGPAIIDSGVADSGQSAILYGPAVIDSGPTDAGPTD